MTRCYYRRRKKAARPASNRPRDPGQGPTPGFDVERLEPDITGDLERFEQEARRRVGVRGTIQAATSAVQAPVIANVELTTNAHPGLARFAELPEPERVQFVSQAAEEIIEPLARALELPEDITAGRWQLVRGRLVLRTRFHSGTPAGDDATTSGGKLPGHGLHGTSPGGIFRRA
ncbi:MAG TPA: hypothetical protein VNZ57_12340 [Longimicrobiales bacterium]|nr:hypothetical protein [Longimicrobiales bacterium]